jgi:hypothetical protein
MSGSNVVAVQQVFVPGVAFPAMSFTACPPETLLETADGVTAFDGDLPGGIRQ